MLNCHISKSYVPKMGVFPYMLKIVIIIVSIILSLLLLDTCSSSYWKVAVILSSDLKGDQGLPEACFCLPFQCSPIA